MANKKFNLRDVSKFAANVKAWRWAGIHCWSSPEPKLNIVTKDEDNN